MNLIEKHQLKRDIKQGLDPFEYLLDQVCDTGETLIKLLMQVADKYPANHPTRLLLLNRVKAFEHNLDHLLEEGEQCVLCP